MVNSGPAPGRPQILVWPPRDSIKCAKVRVAPAKWIIKRPRAGISLCANSKAAFRALVGGKNFLSLPAKKNKSYFLAQQAYCRKVVRAGAHRLIHRGCAALVIKSFMEFKIALCFPCFLARPCKTIQSLRSARGCQGDFAIVISTAAITHHTS
jgi:hypothetical protein